MELQQVNDYVFQVLTITAPIGLALAVIERVLRFAISFFTGKEKIEL